MLDPPQQPVLPRGSLRDDANLPPVISMPTNVENGLTELPDGSVLTWSREEVAPEVAGRGSPALQPDHSRTG